MIWSNKSCGELPSAAHSLHVLHLFLFLFLFLSLLISPWFLQCSQNRFGSMGEEKQTKGQVPTMMDQTELSLGPSSSTLSKKTQSSSSESEGCGRRKRKQIWDANPGQSSIELQLNDPLPLDLERCLDLQTGRIYYINRKTLKRIWSMPKEQNLDLELNISTLSTSEETLNSRSTTPEEAKKQHSSCGSMAAVVCVNCHLLVMLCKSSPSCPNCKCMQTPLPSAPQAPPQKLQSSKSSETLSLLH